ncbi:MAG: M20/M25/M40 family metallo-hydrolase [Euryarchaeota archaeon]|nr:M20/M25/M40 family metallo-hydrolase [Euryarchaeota archaeon]
MKTLVMLLTFALITSTVTLGFTQGHSKDGGSDDISLATSIDQDSEIRSILRQIDEGLMASFIQPLQDFDTRYAYTHYSIEAAGWIGSVMERFELNVTYDDNLYNDHIIRNVIGELPGTDPNSTQIWIICAHYDSYSSSSRYWAAPGADDDASGVAGVLAAAEILSDYRFNDTIRFIAWGGEELMMRGSQPYAEKMLNEGADIAGVFNLDMIGHNPDPTFNTTSICTNSESVWLANNTSNICKKYSDIIGIQGQEIVGFPYSDHASFWAVGYDGVMLIEVFNQNFNDDYHTPQDTIDKLNMTYAANNTQMAVATLCEMAGMARIDDSRPSHYSMFPEPGGWGNQTPVISVCVSDASDIDASSIRLYVKGYRVIPNLTRIPLGYNVSYWHQGAFMNGASVRCSVWVTDLADAIFRRAWIYNWTFAVDGVPPAPPENLTIRLEAVLADKLGMVVDRGPDNSDLLHAERPSVLNQDSEFKMWYSGADGSYQYRIHYANSTDGLTWTKYGVVLDIGEPDTPDGVHVAWCSVLWNAEYQMWYSGSNETTWRIMYANSSDGLSWNKHGVVLDIGNSSDCDSMRAYSPSVILDGTTYKMWYTGWDGIAQRILYAESSDGLTWVKNRVALDVGAFNDFDRLGASAPVVLHSGAQYRMWYTGHNGSTDYVLYASSSNGIDWIKKGLCVNSAPIGELDSGRIESPGAIIVNGTTYVYYSGQDYLEPQKRRIFLATQNATSPKTALILEFDDSTSTDVPQYRVRFSQSLQAIKGASGELVFASGNAFALPNSGDGNSSSFYARVSSVDRVGHVSESWDILGKVGYGFVSDWALLGSPFGSGALITEHLATVYWEYVMAYDAHEPANYWKTNYTGREDFLDDLTFVEARQGLWVRSAIGEIYVAVGRIANSTTELESGWNLVAMPYATGMLASDVMGLIGPACSLIEGFDPSQTYRTIVLSGTDIMQPGQAYWLYVSSKTTWLAYNY